MKTKFDKNTCRETKKTTSAVPPTKLKLQHEHKPDSAHKRDRGKQQHNVIFCGKCFRMLLCVAAAVIAGKVQHLHGSEEEAEKKVPIAITTGSCLCFAEDGEQDAYCNKVL